MFEEGSQGLGAGVEDEAGDVIGKGVRIAGISVLELIPRASPTFGQTSKYAVNVKYTELARTTPA